MLCPVQFVDAREGFRRLDNFLCMDDGDTDSSVAAAAAGAAPEHNANRVVCPNVLSRSPCLFQHTRFVDKESPRPSRLLWSAVCPQSVAMAVAQGLPRGTIELRGASFRWALDEQAPNTLADVSLKVCVVGSRASCLCIECTQFRLWLRSR